MLTLLKRYLKLNRFNICTLLLICLFYFHYFLHPIITTTSSLTLQTSSLLPENDTVHDDFKQILFKRRLVSYYSIYNYNNNKSCTRGEKGQSVFPDNQLSEFSKLLPILEATIIPYPERTFFGRGIVLTVGSQQLKYALVNIRLIIFINTSLPIEIWYSDAQLSKENIKLLQKESEPIKNQIQFCCFRTKICQRNNNQEHNITHVWDVKIDHFEPKIFPYKPAAIISSSFEEVLFLDCDSYLTRDPIDLFTKDIMYKHFGALFYPDALRNRQDPKLWNVLNTYCFNEYEFDSAAILVNKSKVWKSLYLTKLLNDNRRLLYKLSDGDKDTFRYAFRYLKQNYYLVSIPCTMGSYSSGIFCGLSLCKTDSLGEHVYISHIHLPKYHPTVSYIKSNFEYIRLGLGDPNNLDYYTFHHCPVNSFRSDTTCFRLDYQTSLLVNDTRCQRRYIPLSDINPEKFINLTQNTVEEFNHYQLIMAKTDVLVPNFLDKYLEIRKNIF